MSLATAMYVSERNPLKKLTYKSGKITIPRGLEQRRLHKALLRYHDPAGWPVIREALTKMRKGHLIGSAASALIPADDPKANNLRGAKPAARNASPNARAQTAANPRTKPAAPTAAKKPAAKALGDKFESAKKFNAQNTKPNAKQTTGAAKSDSAKRPVAKPFSAPKNKR